MAISFRRTGDGFYVATPSPQTLREARERTAAGDAAKANGFENFSPPAVRYAGFIGEAGFNRWLVEQLGDGEHEWHGGDDARPDFEVQGRRVGLKTQTIHVQPWPWFWVVVPAQHRETPTCDEFFFAAYQDETNMLWLFGGISAERFFDLARYRDVGQPIGPRTIAKNPVYQLQARQLEAPAAWLLQAPVS